MGAASAQADDWFTICTGELYRLRQRLILHAYAWEEQLAATPEQSLTRARCIHLITMAQCIYREATETHARCIGGNGDISVDDYNRLLAFTTDAANIAVFADTPDDVFITAARKKLDLWWCGCETMMLRALGYDTTHMADVFPQ